MNKQNLPPFKKALRNAAVITALVGIIVQFQQSDSLQSLSTMAFTFVFVFPALWLSFRFTSQIIEKHTKPTSDDATTPEKNLPNKD